MCIYRESVGRDMASVCCSGWRRTRDPPASASQVLRGQTHTTASDCSIHPCSFLPSGSVRNSSAAECKLLQFIGRAGVEWGGNTAQWMRCCLSKHKDLSLDARYPPKLGTVESTCNLIAGWERQKDPEGLLAS